MSEMYNAHKSEPKEKLSLHRICDEAKKKSIMYSSISKKLKELQQIKLRKVIWWENKG